MSKTKKQQPIVLEGQDFETFFRQEVGRQKKVRKWFDKAIEGVDPEDPHALVEALLSKKSLSTDEWNDLCDGLEKIIPESGDE